MSQEVLVLENETAQNIEVLFQDEVQLDIQVSLLYIKSGEEEIQAYVDNHAKPEIDEFVADEEASLKQNVDTFAQNQIIPDLENKVSEANVAAQSALEAVKLSQAASLLAQDWACKTDDVVAQTDYSAKYYAQLAQECASNISFDNLCRGCVKEVPQYLNLELSSDATTMTLKASSKVYIPNGFEADGITQKFDEVVLDEDISGTQSGTNDCAFFSYCGDDYKSLTVYPANYVFVGDTEPSSPVEGYIWYDVTANILKQYADGGWVGRRLSLPICMFANNESVMTQFLPFAGIGYLGNIIFALPEVKVLLPNGRNANGSLKNEEYVFDNVRIFLVSGNGQYYLLVSENSYQNVLAQCYYVQDTKPSVSGDVSSWYSPYENKMYWTDDKGVSWQPFNGVVLAKCQMTSGQILSFEAAQPFCVANAQEVFYQHQVQVVTTLPETPQNDVFYFVAE